MVKKSEEKREVDRLGILEKNASELVDKEIEIFKFDPLSRSILCEYMNRWIIAKKTLEEYKYKFEREKFFISGIQKNKEESPRIYVDLEKIDEVMG